MVQLLLIGIGAGVASALLFASIASGTMLSIVLFYVAALPILIATIGWNTLSGLIAAAIAAIGLGIIIDWRFLVAFTLSVGGPAWWLGYLAMLARPADNDGDPATPDALEWYPAGRLVIWAALLGALGVVTIIPYFGLDRETFDATLRSSFERMFRAQTTSDGALHIPGVKNPQQFLDVLVVLMPLAAALIGTLVHTFNLWLSARIVRLSGRLKRSWPDIPSIEFPPLAAAGLAVALAGSFLPGIIGLLASILAVALLTAYGLLGLAVLHAITRGTRSRVFILIAAYVMLVFQGWPILLASLLGLINSAIDLRRRVAAWQTTRPNNP